MQACRLVIPRRLFEDTLAELARRSGGRRESAAVWAGTLDGDVASATEVYFHHELCDDQGRALSLELTERAKFDLYNTLRQRGLKLVALIHTHPGEWVDLSPIDEQNQICSRIGFWSIVVPNYARRPWQPTSMGIHLRADVGWYRVADWDIPARVIIEG